MTAFPRESSRSRGRAKCAVSGIRPGPRQASTQRMERRCRGCATSRRPRPPTFVVGPVPRIISRHPSAEVRGRLWIRSAFGERRRDDDEAVRAARDDGHWPSPPKQRIVAPGMHAPLPRAPPLFLKELQFSPRCGREDGLNSLATARFEPPPHGVWGRASGSSRGSTHVSISTLRRRAHGAAGDGVLAGQARGG